MLKRIFLIEGIVVGIWSHRIKLLLPSYLRPIWLPLLLMYIKLFLIFHVVLEVPWRVVVPSQLSTTRMILKGDKLLQVWSLLLLELWKTRFLRRNHIIVFLKVLWHPWIFLIHLLVIVNGAFIFATSIIFIGIFHIFLNTLVMRGFRSIGIVWTISSAWLLIRARKVAVMLLVLCEWHVFGLSTSIDGRGRSIWVSDFISSEGHHTSILAMIASVLLLFSLVILIRIIKLTGWNSTLLKNFNNFLEQLVAVRHILIRYPRCLMLMILSVLLRYMLSRGMILVMRVVLLKILLRAHVVRNITLWVFACMILIVQ